MEGQWSSSTGPAAHQHRLPLLAGGMEHLVLAASAGAQAGLRKQGGVAQIHPQEPERAGFTHSQHLIPQAEERSPPIQLSPL